MKKYELEASGSSTFVKEYDNLLALEYELKTANFPGRLSVCRVDLNEEVAHGSQSDVLFKIKMAKEHGFNDLQGFFEN